MKLMICMLLAIVSIFFINPPTKPVIIAYVGGFRGLADIDSINPRRVSHINYAFVDVKDNRAWLHNEVTDTINFRRLNELKKINPDLKILISIGGWTWSKNFSDAVFSDTSRKAFAETSVDIIAKYKLDGVDIDWEYPGLIGDNNKFRPEDKQNYTLMFMEIRKKLDSLQKITKKKYLLTTAVGGSYDFIEHSEMDKVQRYTDFINVMSYDYAGPSDTISSHHTNLYTSSTDTSRGSTHKSIQAYLAAGVPASKLVVGLGFYGKGWEMLSAENNGLYRRVVKPVRGLGFHEVKDSMINKNGFTMYWDSVANAPYLFNPDSKIFFTYDNERSIKLKADYVKKHKLGGAMFWEYEDDRKEQLLKVVADAFGY